MKYFVSFTLLALVAAVLMFRSAQDTPAGAAGVEPVSAELDKPLVVVPPAVSAPEVAAADSDAEVQADAVTWTADHAVKLSSFGLFKIEVECDEITGERRCHPVPGTLMFDHPYWTYPVESLEAMPGDAVANHVLGMRLARNDPEKGLSYIVRAAGLSGKPGSLVDFIQESPWSRTAVNGVPDVENLKKRLAVLSAAERLGHTMTGAAEVRQKLEGLITPDEMERIDATADVIAEEVRSIEVTVEYQS